MFECMYIVCKIIEMYATDWAFSFEARIANDL